MNLKENAPTKPINFELSKTYYQKTKCLTRIFLTEFFSVYSDVLVMPSTIKHLINEQCKTVEPIKM